MPVEPQVDPVADPVCYPETRFPVSVAFVRSREALPESKRKFASCSLDWNLESRTTRNLIMADLRFSISLKKLSRKSSAIFRAWHRRLRSS